jgi:hypothetical protein
MTQEATLEKVCLKMERLQQDMQGRFREETSNLVSKIGELDSAFKVFYAHLDDLSQIDKKMEKQIDKYAEDLPKRISKQIVTQFEEDIASPIHRLHDEISRVHKIHGEQISKMNVYKNKKHFLWALGFCSALFLGSWGIFWYIYHNPKYHLTEDFTDQYEWGHILKTIWPKLSEKEKKHLKSLL